MQVNSLGFFNFYCNENLSLISKNVWKYVPNFELNYYINEKNKMFIIQTFELFYQFYGIRPKIHTLKKFGKYQNFKLLVSIRSSSFYTLFFTLFNVRSSSKTKLINFRFKETRDFYVSIKDFITLFPFKIRFYDFHSWRNEVVIHTHFKNFSILESFAVINFFYSFFKSPRKYLLCLNLKSVNNFSIFLI
jgi:hypothetical protein